MPSPARVIRHVVAALMLGAALPALAAPAPAPLLRFQPQTAIGISDLAIISLVQDRQGFIWIGTSAGLYRFDGYKTVRYSNEPGNQRSLPHDRVAEIFEDGDGRLWIGTQEGLARYDPGSDDFTRFTSGLGRHTALIVKRIVSDGAHGMWISTWGGMQHFDTRSGKFTLYTHDPKNPDSLAANDTNAVARDAKGGVWVATWPGGVDYLAPGSNRFRHHRIDWAERPDSKMNIARSLHIDADGNLWIGTEKGVIRLKAGAPWDEREVLPSEQSRVHRFYSDRSGSVWAGTLSSGLLRWTRGSDIPEHFRHHGRDKYSLSSGDVRSLMQDRGGMLWVGTYTDGISLVNLNSSGFRRLIPHDEEVPGMPSATLVSIATAPQGRLWLGTTRGFSLFDPASAEVVRSYQANPGQPGALSNNIVYSLYQQPGGPLWVGTSAGLNRLDRHDGSFTVIRFDKLASGFINTIAPSRDGTLWLGTGANVIRYNPATGDWKVYESVAGVPGTRSVTGTTVILEDRQGRVWMGSEWNGGGLDLLDQATGKFRNFRHMAGTSGTLNHDSIASLHEDARGRVWVGTSKGVHQVLTGKDGSITFRTYSIPGGAGAARAQAIRDDAAGMLWISNASGLIRLDPDSGNMERFTVTDGLSGSYMLGAAERSASGQLYFGGTRGLTVVDPGNVRTQSVAPQVAITDITVLNRSLKEDRHVAGAELQGPASAPRALTLTADASVFSIEFASLHYTNPGANRYAYRLVGFDADWVQVDANHRIATYTTLDPGEYRFEVKATNDRGVWSRDAAGFNITILPPFWSTWWFRTLAGLAAFALLATAYRLRVRSLTRQQVLLMQLVSERTRELQLTNAKLAELTTTDSLTGIANRRGFDHAMAREWRRASRTGSTIALAMLDVDHFKSYNDRYGHQAGDDALRSVAALISAHARRTTDVVARYGGEEFALLAPAASLDQVMKLANDICAALQERALPHAGAPGGIITISIGVAATTPAADEEPCSLIARADQALYRAKQEGRNRAVCVGAEAAPDEEPAEA